MKQLKYIIPLMLMAVVTACKKETAPVASDELGIVQQFSPAADADPRVKEMYTKFDVWMRMDFNNWKEVTNAILAIDQTNRWGVGKIEPTDRESAIIWMQTLLSNVPEKYTKSFFPLEFFFVKTYSASFWAKDILSLGRSRLIICWPNKMQNAQPITNPLTHYYKDSVLTRTVWSYIGQMITNRMEEPIKAFVTAGKAYDNGQAADRIMDEYFQDYDAAKRDAAMDELARSGGFISGTSSGSFNNDFSQWLKLLVTESYENIKTQYLDNSPARAQKYAVLIKYFQDYGWDIQATGNLYREKLDN